MTTAPTISYRPAWVDHLQGPIGHTLLALGVLSQVALIVLGIALWRLPIAGAGLAGLLEFAVIYVIIRHVTTQEAAS
ncbi:hypothetical protein ACSL103130_12705 [Actinomyces slackii]|uniref:Uncharacterized protein n=1 Tax=Actinomyces slackii TaxID=52774 RepID=A0A3S4TDY6_9ACTO|nr:hypothetical protein [Actinomyces slackii]VEG75718.1 Uncharacterised protein [Actinomyces slackii]